MIPMPIRLAPMAGITDWPFRTLCFEQGADLCYTEMISAMGYLCAPKTNIATQHLLTVGPDEGPVIVQIFGKEPQTMAKAAEALSLTGRYVGVDINMGCPAHKVVGSGEGSALMKDPILAGQIMEAVVHATLLPVTVKLRLGWDEQSKNILELAHIAKESGITQIAVHGRTRAQHYSGKADWDMIAEVKQKMNMPILANGDIFCAADALKIMTHTKCDGIMVGRGALGNPWLFWQIKQAMAGEEVTDPTMTQRVETARRHAQMLCAWKTEPFAVKEMRKHMAWYIQGVRGAAQMRAAVNQAKTLNELHQALDDVLLACND